ncbi:MAG: BatA domain-containing protein, partial [Opitutales bacterium]
MSFFQFHAPAFLALLGLLPVVAWWVGRMGPEAAVRFSNTGLLRSLGLPRRSRAGRFLFGLRLLALAAFITALARPQFVESHDTTEAEGIDIVSILDMSGSMRALDLS